MSIGIGITLYLNSESVIVAAANNQKLLDQVLFRRPADVLHYTLPTSKEIKHFIAYI